MLTPSTQGGNVACVNIERSAESGEQVRVFDQEYPYGE
jgi:hypothetical protein